MSKFYKSIKVTFLSVLAYTILVPLIFLIFGTALIVRKCVVRFVQISKGGQLRVVPASSVGMSMPDVYGPQAWTIVCSMEVDSAKIDVAKFRSDFNRRILTAKNETGGLSYHQMTSSLVEHFGYLFWKPCPTFAVEDHIKTIEFPELTDVHNSEEMDKFSNYLLREKHWEQGKPLWEFLIIENVQGKSLLIFRIHHIIADGWATLKMAAKSLVPEESHALLQQTLPVAKINQRAHRNNFIRGILSWIKGPYQVVNLITEMAGNNVQIPPPTISSSPTLSSTSGLSSAALNSTTLLHKLKKVKAEHGVDFMSVLLSGLAGAVRQSFLERNPLNPVPDNIKVGFTIPSPGHPDKLTNHGSMALILLPIGEENSEERIRLIGQRVSSFVNSGLPNIVFIIRKIIGCLPIYIQSRSEGMKNIFPIGISNTVGPTVPCNVAGEEILNLKFGLNISFEAGFAFGLGFITYNGQSTLGTIGLKEHFPNISHPQEVLLRCTNEWDKLIELASQKTVLEME